MKRKLKLIFSCFVLILAIFSFENITVVKAENNSAQEEIEKELNENVNETINDFDFSPLDQLAEKLADSDKLFFNSSSFVSKLKQILSGEFADGYNSLFKAVVNLFFEYLLNVIPLLALIVAVAILSSFFNNVKPSSSEVGEIIHLVCLGVIATIVVKFVCDFIALSLSVLQTISQISDVVFPILLTLVASMGGTVSVSVYQPVVLIFSNAILKIFSSTLITLFVLYFVFNLISCFSKKIKFSKLSSFFSSTFKWILGIVFFIFMAYLSLQGITASTLDSMKIRTAKFAVRNYVPLVGGYLSEGFDFILSSLALVKNAVGICAILLLISLLFSVVLKIAVFGLGLKLVCGICEPICDDRITNFLHTTSKSFSMLVALLLGAGFIFLIIVGLIILTLGAV